MKEKINIAELLKGCPKGLELDCTICNGVKFIELDKNPNYPIVVRANNGYEFSLTKYGQVHNIEDAKCVIYPKGKTTWEGFQRPFMDGDVVATTNGLWIGITTGGEKGKFIPTYCVIRSGDEFKAYPDRKGEWAFNRLATEEEKAKLFQAIKDNGYKWNPETKTLEKLSKFKVGDRVRNKNYKDYIYDIHDITDKGYRAKEINADSPIIILFGSQEDNYELVPNKFDVINFEPFMKVLVRDNNEQFWTCDWFSFHDTKQVYPFVCVGHYVSQCIPYEGNEHLLGKTGDCDEYYKNW